MQLNSMEAHRSVMAPQNFCELKAAGRLVDILQHQNRLHGTANQVLERCAHDRVGPLIKEHADS